MDLRSVSMATARKAASEVWIAALLSAAACSGGLVLAPGSTCAIVAGSFDDYVRVMCEEYGMLVGEARELSDDRFSFLAIPLVNGRSAVGVVDLDSTEPDFLSDAGAPNVISPHMVAMISTSCGGLAPYTRLTYPE
jgi:hypothetical protein